MVLASTTIAAAGIAILVAAALHDAAFRTVPNGLTAALLLSGVGARLLDGWLMPSLLAATLVFAAAFLCWRRGLMGGGDVKLLGAAAVLVPPAAVPSMLAVMAIAGGVLAVPYLIGRRGRAARPVSRPLARLPSLRARVARAERWRLRRGGPLPYAVAIAAGACFAIVEGSLS